MAAKSSRLARNSRLDDEDDATSVGQFLPPRLRRTVRRSLTMVVTTLTKQEAPSLVYGAASAPRMARGSNILADESKPTVTSPTYKAAAPHRLFWTKPRRLAQHSRSANRLEPMSTDEMIEYLGSCRARWELAAMIEALSGTRR